MNTRANSKIFYIFIYVYNIKIDRNKEKNQYVNVNIMNKEIFASNYLPS